MAFPLLKTLTAMSSWLFLSITHIRQNSVQFPHSVYKWLRPKSSHAHTGQDFLKVNITFNLNTSTKEKVKKIIERSPTTTWTKLAISLDYHSYYMYTA